MKVQFELEKTTKNTVRFKEMGTDVLDDDQVAIGTLYVQKAALEHYGYSEGDWPDEITVVVELE